MQQLIDDLKEANDNHSQDLSLAIIFAESMLEKEKDVMLKFADDVALAAIEHNSLCDWSEKVFKSTFNSK